MNVRSRGRGMRGRGMNVRSRGRGITLFGNSVPGGTRVSTARRNERGGMITVRSRCTRVRRQERTGLRSELGKHGHPTQKRRSQKYIKLPPPAKAPGSGRPSLQQLYRTLQAIGEAISVTQAIRCCHPIAKVPQLWTSPRGPQLRTSRLHLQLRTKPLGPQLRKTRLLRQLRTKPLGPQLWARTLLLQKQPRGARRRRR